MWGFLKILRLFKDSFKEMEAFIEVERLFKPFSKKLRLLSVM
jgi:hypothetical protein